MSGTSFNLGGLLGLSDWTTQLLPASFRGVPFYVRGHAQEAGRRIVKSQYPLRDTSDTEDMGREQEDYQIDAYVIGADYMAQTSALYRACVLSSNSGSLVHPYLGRIVVRCAKFRRTETDREGGIARIALTFVEAGGMPSPLASVDTSSSALGWVSTAFTALKSLYTLAMVVADHPGFLLGLLGAQLELLGDALLGLPAGTLEGFASLVASITAAPSDMVATPAAIATAFEAYADGVAQAAPDTFPAGADPSFGLTALASFGASFPAVPLTTPDRIQQATNQAVLVMMVQASAAVATAQIYAQTTFTSSNAATSARNQLTDWIDTLSVQAADAGWTDLYVNLTGLYAAVVADMTARAQQLPALGFYATKEPLPSLVLAQLLYQDPARAGELAALNEAQHPAFMPMTGVALTT